METMWIHHPNSLHRRRLRNLPRLYFLICWVGTVMLPILHRAVQRWNEEMLIKSLVHCLTHKEHSISSLEKKLGLLISHDLNGDSEQDTGGENCCFQGTFYTLLTPQAYKNHLWYIWPLLLRFPSFPSQVFLSRASGNGLTSWVLEVRGKYAL